MPYMFQGKNVSRGLDCEGNGILMTTQIIRFNITIVGCGMFTVGWPMSGRRRIT